MMGWIGDDPTWLSLHIFCDADFAGCPFTLKSTSGTHCDIQGPNSRFPWAAQAQQQMSRANSTPAAEFDSLDKGMRRRGEPGLAIWQLLLAPYHELGWSIVINLHEDNSTTCVA